MLNAFYLHWFFSNLSFFERDPHMDSPEGIRDNQGGDQEEISCGTEQVAGSVQDQDQKTSLFIFVSIF